MTGNGAQIAAAAGAGSETAARAANDWQAVRADASIQYAPLAPVKPPEPPAWLAWLGEWLQGIFGPVGKGMATGFFVIVALALLYIGWRVLRRMLDARRDAVPRSEPEWAPDRAEAVALLEDADRLAAEGRFAEAVHLLLRRSVGHILEARPDWLRPASTAREIAELPMLPARAREAFGAIATRVERSRFALRHLDAGDWTEARAAYADFALADLKVSGVPA